MSFISSRIYAYRSKVEGIVSDLHTLTKDIGHEELAKTVNDLRARIHEPFLFVIVGEVKAGKSSFINALLQTGREICKVAPQPMTDTIQQVIYGETEETITINPYLKKIFQPVEILRLLIAYYCANLVKQVIQVKNIFINGMLIFSAHIMFVNKI